MRERDALRPGHRRALIEHPALAQITDTLARWLPSRMPALPRPDLGDLRPLALVDPQLATAIYFAAMKVAPTFMVRIKASADALAATAAASEARSSQSSALP